MQANIVQTYEKGDTTDVIVDIVILYSMLVYALIDPSSSPYYINDGYVKSRDLKSEMLKVAMVVSSPLRQTVLVDQMCRRCPLKIQNRSFHVDLLIMSFGDFDEILGMDWLTKHGVVLDCCRKKFLV